jgi:hypothetical protein
MPAARPGVPACLRSGLAGPDHGEGSRPGCRWHGKNYPLHERRNIVAHAGNCDSGLVDHLRSAFSAATSASVAMSAASVPATAILSVILTFTHADRSTLPCVFTGSHPCAGSPAQATSRRRPSSAASRPARSRLRSAHRPDARSVRRLCTARCSASARLWPRSTCRGGHARPGMPRAGASRRGKSRQRSPT